MPSPTIHAGDTATICMEPIHAHFDAIIRYRLIDTGTGEQIVLTKDISLPFAPYPGLTIINQGDGFRFTIGRPDTISWSLDSEMFIVETVVNCPSTSIEERVSGMVEEGWMDESR